MNTNTLDKMRKLKFFGMFHAFKATMEADNLTRYTADEMVAHLIEAEWDDRQNRNVERRLNNARFRYKASVEDMYYHADRNLDRNQVRRLAECNFINRQENLLITGSTGTLVKATLPLPLATRHAYLVTGCSMPIHLSSLPG